jgi:hypothetical protein
VTGPPRVHLVFWGRGWGMFGDYTFTRDPFGGTPKLQEQRL